MLINKDVRKLHAAWLEWLLVVRYERKLELERQHLKQMSDARVAHVETAVITLLLKKQARSAICALFFFQQTHDHACPVVVDAAILTVCSRC